MIPLKARQRYIVLWVWCVLVSIPKVQAQSNEYLVTWLGIPVVDVTVTLTPQDTVILGRYTAKTRSWFDPIYPVDNRYNIICDAVSFSPSNYSKQIIEKGIETSFSVAYNAEQGVADYSNGLRRNFPKGYYNFFSSMLWIERRSWLKGERHDIQIEIEGTLWQVEVHCRKIVEQATGPQAEIEVNFVATVAGEPVLSYTDIVTHKLAKVGRKMIFFVQLNGQLIEAIEFGRPPFMVRAVLIPS